MSICWRAFGRQRGVSCVLSVSVRRALWSRSVCVLSWTVFTRDFLEDFCKTVWVLCYHISKCLVTLRNALGRLYVCPVLPSAGKLCIPSESQAPARAEGFYNRSAQLQSEGRMATYYEWLPNSIITVMKTTCFDIVSSSMGTPHLKSL